jgi:hypothetical protein
MQIVTTDEALGWANGQTYVAAYGIISYDDVFGAHRWTKWCRWRVGKVAEGAAAATCAQYNDAQ